jgi:hypothetical protein
MPGTVIHQGASVICMHGGQAQPTSTLPRILVSGMPVAVQTMPHVVVGCALPPPPAGNGPCVTAPWVVASVRVLANAMPLVLFDSQAIAVPSGTPLRPVATQTRVLAT